MEEAVAGRRRGWRAVWLVILAVMMPAIAQAQGAAAPARDSRYDWLEPANDPAAVAWAKTRTAATMHSLLSDPRSKAVLSDVERIARLAAVPPPFAQPYSVLGRRLARVIIDSAHPAGIIQTAPRGTKGATGPWKTVLDVDALNAAEHQQYGLPVLNLSTSCLPPEYRRCMITLGLRGSEIQRIREFDLDTGRFVDGGFAFADAKSEFAWLDQDTLLVAQAIPGETLNSGFPSTVRLWKRGTPYADAKVVFHSKPSDFMFRLTGAGIGKGRKGVISVARQSDLYETLVVGKDGVVQPTHLPTLVQYPGNLGLSGGTARYVAVMTADPVTLGGKPYPEGTVFAYDISDGTPPSKRISVVYTPPKGTYLYDGQFGATYSRDRIYLVATHNLRQSLLAATPSKQGWKIKTVLTADRGEWLTVWGGGLAADAIAVGTEGYLTPPTTSLAEDGRCCTQIARQQAVFDSSKFVVDFHSAKTRDGALIDYYLVRPRNPKAGPVPTIISAYGGGGAVIGPAYAARELDGGLVPWLNRGGAFAFAYIRGGGEKGSAWWHAGSGRDKINGIDDVAAVAEDLIRSGFTAPARLGFTGRSYGGLLATAVAVKHPALFVAVLPGVPLVDAYPVAGGTRQLAAVDHNIGDPGDPGDLAAMLQYMPFENVQPGVKYPHILTVCSTSDDRVGPGPARRFTAKLESVGAKPLLMEGPTGGHLFPKASANPEAVTAEVLFFMKNLMD